MIELGIVGRSPSPVVVAYELAPPGSGTRGSEPRMVQGGSRDLLVESSDPSQEGTRVASP